MPQSVRRCLKLYVSTYLKIHASVSHFMHVSDCTCLTLHIDDSKYANVFQIKCKCLRLYVFPFFLHGSTALVDLDHFFSFLIYTQSVGLLERGIKPVARPLPTHRTTQTQNECTQTSIPRVVFEPTTPAFERAKTDHALDCGPL
jgi:hypothetical protein